MEDCKQHKVKKSLFCADCRKLECPKCSLEKTCRPDHKKIQFIEYFSQLVSQKRDSLQQNMNKLSELAQTQNKLEISKNKLEKLKTTEYHEIFEAINMLKSRIEKIFDETEKLPENAHICENLVGEIKKNILNEIVKGKSELNDYENYLKFQNYYQMLKIATDKPSSSLLNQQEYEISGFYNKICEFEVKVTELFKSIKTITKEFIIQKAYEKPQCTENFAQTISLKAVPKIIIDSTDSKLAKNKQTIDSEAQTPLNKNFEIFSPGPETHNKNQRNFTEIGIQTIILKSATKLVEDKKISEKIFSPKSIQTAEFGTQTVILKKSNSRNSIDHSDSNTDNNNNNGKEPLLLRKYTNKSLQQEDSLELSDRFSKQRRKSASSLRKMLNRTSLDSFRLSQGLQNLNKGIELIFASFLNLKSVASMMNLPKNEINSLQKICVFGMKAGFGSNEIISFIHELNEDFRNQLESVTLDHLYFKDLSAFGYLFQQVPFLKSINLISCPFTGPNILTFLKSLVENAKCVRKLTIENPAIGNEWINKVIQGIAKTIITDLRLIIPKNSAAEYMKAIIENKCEQLKTVDFGQIKGDHKTVTAIKELSSYKKVIYKFDE